VPTHLAGIDLIPIGYINQHHEPTQFYSVNRPELYNGLIPSTWRAGASPDESRVGVNIGGFPALPQDWRAVPTAATILRARTAVGQPDLAIFPWHLDTLLPSVALERMTIGRLMPALVAAAAAVSR
jgi:hypothetical protein